MSGVCLAPDLRRQRAEHRNPAARPALVGFKVLHVDTGLTPRKTPFAGEQEGIDEVLERRIQPLDREHQLLRRDPPGAGLYRRHRLPIVESEYLGQILLGEPAFLSQRLNPFADQLRRHPNLRV